MLDLTRTSLGIYLGCVAVIGYSVRAIGAPARLLYGVVSALVLLLVYVTPDSLALEVVLIGAGAALLAADLRAGAHAQGRNGLSVRRPRP